MHVWYNKIFAVVRNLRAWCFELSVEDKKKKKKTTWKDFLNHGQGAMIASKKHSSKNLGLNIDESIFSNVLPLANNSASASCNAEISVGFF